MIQHEKRGEISGVEDEAAQRAIADVFTEGEDSRNKRNAEDTNRRREIGQAKA